jgi:hypothetical protein
LIAIDNKETEDQELWKQLPNTEGEERAELLIQLAQQALYRSSGNEALALAEQAHEIYQGIIDSNGKCDNRNWLLAKRTK